MQFCLVKEMSVVVENIAGVVLLGWGNSAEGSIAL